jgi:hypothetical protein
MEDELLTRPGKVLRQSADRLDEQAVLGDRGISGSTRPSIPDRSVIKRRVERFGW